MWTSLIAIIAAVLGILKEWLTWQVALTKINARKLAYDIDQQQIAKGQDLLAKINSARNAGDLAATSLLLDDQANAALYSAGIRSAIPNDSGPNVGLGSGISESPAPGGGSDHSAQSSPSPVATQPVIVSPAPPMVPTKPTKPAIPAPPYAVTGLGTWFGRNPDGSDDKGDVDSRGRDLLGAFGDDCHNEDIVGLSIPIPIFRATFGRGDAVYHDVARRRWLFDVVCPQTGKHATGVWLVDLGPNASLNRPLDMTYGLATMLGLRDNAVCTWWATDQDTGKMVEIKGWDFATGRNEV